MLQGVGASAQLNAFKASITAITNRDYSSAITVGRAADNTLDVVISPNNMASGEPALLNQTYDVAVLLLVPRNYFGGRLNPSAAILALRSFTELRDARTGDILPQRDDRSLDDRGASLIREWVRPEYQHDWDKAPRAERVAFVQSLGDAVTTGDLDELWGALKKKTTINGRKCTDSCFNDTGPRVQTLWPVVASLNEDSPAKIVPFQMPLPAPIRVPPQTVQLNDDGTHPIQAVLYGVQARSSANLAAKLIVTPFTVDPAGGGKAGEAVPVPATAVALNADAHTLTLTFPSLKSLGIACLANDETAEAKAIAAAAKGKCPNRVAGAGTVARPNNIELSVIGCDPGRKLCPSITETRMAPPSEQQAVELTKNALNAKLKVDTSNQLVEAKDSAEAALDLIEAASKAQQDSKAAKAVKTRNKR